VSEGREGRARERERHFGRVVLRTLQMEIYSLDLYETHTTYNPSLVCRGFYLRPVRSRFPLGPVPIRVELSTDDDAFNAIYEMFGAGTFGGEGDPFDPDAPYSGDFELGGPWRNVSPVFHAEVSAPLQLLGRTVWTGRLLGTEGQVTGQFDFILEQYGTIEPVLLLLVALFFVVFYERRNSRQQTEDCNRQALRLCGEEGNIKSVNITSGITGMTMRVDSGCQVECFERWHPSTDGEA
jgi:hypothetical protein